MNRYAKADSRKRKKRIRKKILKREGFAHYHGYKSRIYIRDLQAMLSCHSSEMIHTHEEYLKMEKYFISSLTSYDNVRVE